jgi:hypothetical protein
MNTYIEDMHQRFIAAGSLAVITSIVAEINADMKGLYNSNFHIIKAQFLEKKLEGKSLEHITSIETILKLVPLKERMLPLSAKTWDNVKIAISAYNSSLSSQTMFEPTETRDGRETQVQSPKHK